MRQPIEVLPSPGCAVVALDQGRGCALRARVAAGEIVRVGTPLGAGREDGAVQVHSPVSGRVRAVELRPTPGPLGEALCIVIDGDATDTTERLPAPQPWESSAPEELLARIEAAGIAGLGGAAYPTHAKLAAARRQTARHLVLNGAECEPWICCDDALMRERPADVLLGAQVMLRASGAERCTIAVEDDKPEAIAALEAALAAAGDPRLELGTLGATYPAGAERPLLAALTGVEVPHDALPTDAGVLCHNVGTAAAVAHWARTGAPLTRRIVTVTGSGVRHPANVDACIGTPIAELVAACGGYVGEPLRLIAGGTMTGRALATDAVPVTQSVNCVVVATAADLSAPGPESACIRCGDCGAACPAGLLPQSLLRAIAADDEAGQERLGLGDCIECGCCDYVCPSRIPLTERFRQARAVRAGRLDERRRAEEARDRFQRHEQRRLAAIAAERQSFEAARRRARGEEAD